MQRLYDGQFGDGDVSDIAHYIRLGKLGEAFTSERRCVLLIDEVDKADIEFPNDLLWELDQMEFFIPETHETVKAAQRPVVIITSNAEKELPDAFLRRCIFHFIEFPDAEMMERIVRVHHPRLDERLLALALQAFYWLRGVAGLQKKPSTSELIDWVQALQVGGVPTKTSSRPCPSSACCSRRTTTSTWPSRPCAPAAAGDRRRRCSPRPRELDYLLLLLLPSVVAVVLVALTWRSRVKRQRAAEDEQRRRAASPVVPPPSPAALPRSPAAPPPDPAAPPGPAVAPAPSGDPSSVPAPAAAGSAAELARRRHAARRPAPAAGG